MIYRAARFGLAAWLLGVAFIPRLSAQTSISRPVFSAGGISFDWAPAEAGKNYVVETTDALSGRLWLPAPSTQPWPVAGTSWSSAGLSGSGPRFYRVAAVPAAERGKLLSSNSVTSLTKTFVGLLLASQGVTEIVPQFDITVYRLDYETLDAHGARILASGALVIPQHPGHAVPLLSYQHGTLAKKNEAPSASLTGETGLGMAFASIGYAVALPDYVGLGDSPGVHPYHHARSEATAGVDMLRATRSFCAQQGFALNGQLFLCGYSQGGHATAALQRELETWHTNEFTITASAPMAGAYDLSGVTTDDVLSGRPMPNPYYFAMLLAAYQDVYHIAGSFSNLLASPYDTTLPPLLMGGSSGSDINAQMPPVATQVLRPDVLDSFRNNPNHLLRQALRENDLYRWAPQSPTRLYHCGADQDVIIANSQVALASFHNLGASQVQLIIPLASGTHASCVLPSLLDARVWFDSLKH